jgi:hypothetical protein
VQQVLVGAVEVEPFVEGICMPNSNAYNGDTAEDLVKHVSDEWQNEIAMAKDWLEHIHVVDVVGPAQCPARYQRQAPPKKKRKRPREKTIAEIMEEELASFV